MRRMTESTRRLSDRIRPIRTERDLDRALMLVAELMDAPAASREAEVLDVLSTLIETYEREHHPIDPPTAIDAVRFITASDFSEVRFRYQELPALGPGVANIFMDGVMAPGATAHLAFCPVAGVVVERAEAHARDHTFFLEIPMWNAFDAPGRFVHLARGTVVEELSGPHEGEGAAPFELGGFYDQYVAFFDALTEGRTPTPTLAETRQSVEIAEAMRARRSEF